MTAVQNRIILVVASVSVLEIRIEHMTYEDTVCYPMAVFDFGDKLIIMHAAPPSHTHTQNILCQLI
jgi:hypothetical protein